jgi:hypothetical protein
MPGAQPEAVESAALTAMPAAVDGGPLRVAVVDFQMPFASVLMLMLKWALAWMLVMAALGFLAAIAWAFFLAVIVSAAHR